MFTNSFSSSSWYGDSSCAGYTADHDSPYHRQVRRMEEMERFPEWLAQRIADAIPRHVSELSDQQWDELVWSCNSPPPPSYHFQPPSPRYPIQEPSPYQPYYPPSLEPSYQPYYPPSLEPFYEPSFQEPYQQLCSSTYPIETSPHGPYNPCEEVNPVEEESPILQEMFKLMQGVQSELSELKGRLQSIEHNANLAVAEVLEAEAIHQQQADSKPERETDDKMVAASEFWEEETSDEEVLEEEAQEDAASPQQSPEQQLKPEIEVNDYIPEEVVYDEESDQDTVDEDSLIDIIFDDVDGFVCSDCHGDYICQACTFIATCIEGETNNSIASCGQGEKKSREEEMELNIEIVYKDHSTSLVPSLPLLALQIPELGPEFPQHVPFLGRHECAYLKNDGQLKDLCAWGEEDVTEGSGELESNKQLTTNKSLGGSSRSSPLRVKFLWNAKTKRSPKALRHAWKFPRHGSQKLHGFKDHDMIYIVWDPGGERPSKPWWELQDQFKHKPP